MVKSPEGEVSLDFRGKKPGRGAYVCPDPRVPEAGPESPGPWSGPSSRPMPPEVYDAPGGADEGGARRCAMTPSSISWALAKKAGRLEIGEEPVGAAARAHQARVLLLAADAAANTRAAGRPLRRGRGRPVAPNALHQGGAGGAAGTQLLRHAGGDRRRAWPPPWRRSWPLGTSRAVRPRSSAAEG